MTNPNPFAPAPYQPLGEPPTARPTDLSQATAVEQSRAVAEVQAAVLVAQTNHRVKSDAIAEMRDVTRLASVANRAFFRFPRGGQQVSGPSVHLARELARCWGNVQYGIGELRRDDVKGESEMQAYAWDLQTNARSVTSFIVPHTRDTKKGLQKLTDMRDIYENNANSGARRVRECIFAILPSWFIEEAVDRCNATLKDGGGVPLGARIANSIGAFAGLGVSTAQLEAKLGRASNDWTEHEVAQLAIIWKSIDRGEVRVADEFEPERVSMDDITGPAPQQVTTTTRPAAPAEPEPPAAPKKATARQQAKVRGYIEAERLPDDMVADALTSWTGRDVSRVEDLTDADVAAIEAVLAKRTTNQKEQ